MFGSKQWQEIRDHVGTAVPVTASEHREPEEAATFLWQHTIDGIAALQELGVAPGAICDASNRVAEARLQISEREGAETTR